MRRKLTQSLAVLAIIMLVTGCSGPEEKKKKFVTSGRNYYEKGNYVKARLELKNAIQIDPKFADAYYLLGMVTMKEGNLKGAFGDFTKAVELDPRQFKAHYELGKMFLGAGAADKASEKAELILKDNPNDQDALLLKGAILLSRKEIAPARAFLEKLLAGNMTKPDLYLLLSSACQLGGDGNMAETYLRKGIDANPGSLDLHLALAGMFAGKGRTDDAALEMKKIVAIEPEKMKHRIDLAGLYWSGRQFDKAREVIASLHDGGHNDEESWLAAAGFYVARAKVDEAEQELKKGIARNAKSFQLRFALADLYGTIGRTDQAIAVLGECLGLARDPANPEIIQTKTRLARICLMRQELDKAAGYAGEVLKESPKNADAHLLRGNIYLMKGDGVNAVSEFRSVITDNPNFIPAYIRLAEAHLKNRETNLALDTLQQAAKIDGGSRDVQRAMARFSMEQKNYQRAEAELRAMLKKNPDDLEARGDLGELFTRSRNPGKAEQEYTEITRRAPKSAGGYLSLSRFQLSRGNVGRATAVLEQGLRNIPSSGEMMQILTQLYISQKKFEQARATAETYVKLYPVSALGYILLGSVEDARKDYRKAAAAYEQALAIEPGSAQAANNLAFALCESDPTEKQLDRALDLARKSLAEKPDDPTAVDTLGWVYFKKGDTKQAMEMFTRIVGKFPNNTILNYHMGMVLYKTGNTGEAKARLKKSLAGREDFPGRDKAAGLLATL